MCTLKPCRTTLTQEAQSSAQRAREEAERINQAAESAQRHSEWQARRIAELEAQDELRLVQQYDAHLSALEAQFAVERDELTSELTRLRGQLAKGHSDADRIAELEVGAHVDFESAMFCD